MFGVSITAGGVTYNFALDSEKDVRSLVQNSHRVTNVEIWSGKEKLSDSQVIDMINQEEPELINS
jgi:hypothetical protein